MSKNHRNPMHEARLALNMHPRCCARCRTTGQLCKNPSMSNGRCRMHGGKSTGRPATNGASTKLAISERLEAQKIHRSLLQLIAQIDSRD